MPPADGRTHRTRRILLGVLALAITLAIASYQRRTGPSWPVSVDREVGGTRVTGSLPRSHGGPGDAIVSVQADRNVTGALLWRRYPTDDPWARVPLTREGSTLSAVLPHQPAAGKLEYVLHVRATGNAPERPDDAVATVPADEAVTIRFRSEVPALVLIPHIFFMFVALWVAVRAGLAAAAGEHRVRNYIPWVLLVLVPGGLILGPLVQKLALGAIWTGWPFGHDWTDNKTLIAVVVWGAAWFRVDRRPKDARLAVLAAAVIMIGVYLIPHSIHGSQIDWSAADSLRAPH
jgi:hypothetical protein